MYALVRLVTRILGEPKPLTSDEVGELHRIRERQGWGRTPGVGDLDPAALATITEIVLKVLEARGITGSL